MMHAFYFQFCQTASVLSAQDQLMITSELNMQPCVVRPKADAMLKAVGLNLSAQAQSITKAKLSMDHQPNCPSLGDTLTLSCASLPSNITCSTMPSTAASYVHSESSSRNLLADKASQ